jgi:hypothetical protein
MAQWLAQATHNRLVEGSNPSGPTFDALFKGLLMFPERQIEDLARLPQRSLSTGCVQTDLCILSEGRLPRNPKVAHMGTARWKN